MLISVLKKKLVIRKFVLFLNLGLLFGIMTQAVCGSDGFHLSPSDAKLVVNLQQEDFCPYDQLSRIESKKSVIDDCSVVDLFRDIIPNTKASYNLSPSTEGIRFIAQPTVDLQCSEFKRLIYDAQYKSIGHSSLYSLKTSLLFYH